MGFGHRPVPMVRVGHRPNTCGLRPFKLSRLRSRPLGQVSKGLGLSASRPSLIRSRPLGRLGQVFKGLDLSAKSSKVSTSRPSFLRSRPLGQVSKGLGLRPVYQVFKGLGQVLMVSVRLTQHRAAGWVPISPRTGTRIMTQFNIPFTERKNHFCFVLSHCIFIFRFLLI